MYVGVWILDVGGEGRGPRKSENVFAIQTPVAIAVMVWPGAAWLGTCTELSTGARAVEESCPLPDPS